MKNATTLLSLFAAAILTSCAGVSPTRVIGDTAGAAGGALIGHAISKGNPLITAAGAGAGVLLSETLQGASNALGGGMSRRPRRPKKSDPTGDEAVRELLQRFRN